MTKDQESVARTSLARDGFALLPGLLQAGEMVSLVEAIEAFTQRRSRAGARHLMGSSGVAALSRDTRLLAIARNVLGPAVFPFRATLFDKRAEANWLVAWHQDTALPLCEKRELSGWGPWSVKDGIHYAHAPTSALEQVVALRVHIDDSLNENGPLRVIAGSHKHGVMTDDQVGTLAHSSTSAACLVPRGGGLAMSPLLVHASSKSLSSRPRRVLHIEYAASLDLPDGMRLAIT